MLSSSITEDRAQKDGRRAIRERHVFEDGRVEFVDYLADSKADVASMLSPRAEQLTAASVERAKQFAADELAEKKRATALLTLTDARLADVLKIDLTRLAEMKPELQRLAKPALRVI